jgi:hypothetical protein
LIERTAEYHENHVSIVNGLAGIRTKYMLCYKTVKWWNTYNSKKEEMLHDSEVWEEQSVLGT